MSGCGYRDAKPGPREIVSNGTKDRDNGIAYEAFRSIRTQRHFTDHLVDR